MKTTFTLTDETPDSLPEVLVEVEQFTRNQLEIKILDEDLMLLSSFCVDLFEGTLKLVVDTIEDGHYTGNLAETINLSIQK